MLQEDDRFAGGFAIDGVRSAARDAMQLQNVAVGSGDVMDFVGIAVFADELPLLDKLYG